MHKKTENVRLCCLLAVIITAAACQRTPPDNTKSSAAAFLPKQTASAQGCGDNGELRATLYGAMNGTIRWDANTMDCEGMPRPAGRGARLRFAGPVGDDALQLAVIIALPELERGRVAKELPSNVTIIEEGNGRFFSTANLDSCWTDVVAQTLIDGSTDRYVVKGALYCIAPLDEVNGDASISIDNLNFKGELDWHAK